MQVALVLLAMTALHLLGAFIYVPFWLAYLLALAALAGAVAKSPTARTTSSALAAAGLLGILPWVPVTEKNRFYSDCKAIEKGGPLTAARAKMAAYRLQREFDGGRKPASGLERAHLTFHLSRDDSADWCVVYFVGETVTDVEAFPD